MSELRKELEQAFDYYTHAEAEARHEEQVEHQRAIRHQIEGTLTYAEMAHAGELMALGRLVAYQQTRGWLEYHALPKLAELDRLEAERDQWRNAHGSVVAAKRRLSAKYGAIMRQKPAARYRRLKKWLRRCVTKITHKPSKDC